jgi:hypothetical protein
VSSPQFILSHLSLPDPLMMFLAGYSVFVVRPSDPENPEHTLPETEADLLAETLDETSAQSRPGAQLSTARTHSLGGGSGAGGAEKVTGFEDEDVELQRALQASLGAEYGSGSGTLYEFPDESGPSTTTTARETSVRTTGRSSASPGLGYGGDRSGPPSRRTPVPLPNPNPNPNLIPSFDFDAPDPPTPEMESSDPVAASAVRARLRLEQVQREQAAAMQYMGGGGVGAGYGFGGMPGGMEQDAETVQRQREAQDRVRRAREEVRFCLFIFLSVGINLGI